MCDYCSWIEKLLHPKFENIPTIYTDILNEERKEQEAPKPPVKYDPTVLVHGTVDSISPREEVNATLEKIENAAVKAYKELAKGCEAAEAVEVAIHSLETADQNSDSRRTPDVSMGHHLLVIKDAAMMDSESNAGSVGATTDSLHPISLAKKMLRETDHVLIVESGVRNLENSSNNLALSDEANESLPTPPNSRISKEDIEATKTINDLPKGIRIYGAVARDRKGRLACGISTTDDREESIAKSSVTASGTVLGCGIFSDAESCCSVSGEDRAVYLYAPARKIVERLQLERGMKKDFNASVPIEDLLNEELINFSEDTGDSCVGAAALRVNGKPEVAFTSRFFPWASCIDGVVTSGCVRGEVFEKDVGELDMPLDCRCD